MDPNQLEIDPKQQEADPKQGPMQLKQRLFIGCLGAMALIVANLCVVDLNTVFAHLLPLEAFTYFVRLLGLCAAACVVIYLNSDEFRPVKLFQLGVMAPAIITQMLNGAAVVNKTPTSPTTRTTRAVRMVAYSTSERPACCRTSSYADGTRLHKAPESERLPANLEGIGRHHPRQSMVRRCRLVWQCGRGGKQRQSAQRPISR